MAFKSEKLSIYTLKTRPRYQPLPRDEARDLIKKRGLIFCNAAVIIAVISVIFISGCESKWVRLDSRPVVQAEVQNARAVCRVDEKLAQVEQADTERSKRLSSSKTNQATMLANEDFALEKQVIYAKIDECMQQQGYKKE